MAPDVSSSVKLAVPYTNSASLLLQEVFRIPYRGRSALNHLPFGSFSHL